MSRHVHGCPLLALPLSAPALIVPLHWCLGVVADVLPAERHLAPPLLQRPTRVHPQARRPHQHAPASSGPAACHTHRGAAAEPRAPDRAQVQLLSPVRCLALCCLCASLPARLCTAAACACPSCRPPCSLLLAAPWEWIARPPRASTARRSSARSCCASLCWWSLLRVRPPAGLARPLSCSK